jgi:hypothetical protein
VRAGRCRGESRIQNSIAWWGARIFFFGFADGAGGCFVGGIPLYKLDVETDWAGYTARQGEDFLV